MGKIKKWELICTDCKKVLTLSTNMDLNFENEIENFEKEEKTYKIPTESVISCICGNLIKVKFKDIQKWC